MRTRLLVLAAFACVFPAVPLSSGANCLICFSNEFCGVTGGPGFVRCTVRCQEGSCGCSAGGGFCAYTGSLKGSTHLAKAPNALFAPTCTTAPRQRDESCSVVAPWQPIAELQQLQVPIAQKTSATSFGCRSRVFPNGDVATDCGHSNAIEPDSYDVIRIRTDRGMLLDMAEIEPNLALAIRFLLRASNDTGFDPSTGMVVVGVLGASQVRALILGEHGQQSETPRARRSARFAVEFKRNGEHTTLRLTPGDGQSARGALMQLKLDRDGWYTIARWQPE